MTVPALLTSLCENTFDCVFFGASLPFHKLYFNQTKSIKTKNSLEVLDG